MSALTFLALRRLADGRFHSGEDIARDLGRSRATLSEALKCVPDLGVEIFSVRGKGYRLAEPIEFLDSAAINARLADEGSRIRLEVVDQIDSTSSRLLERAVGGAPSGTCLAAEWQSAGRGRRGRPWVSSLGGSLTFSLLWRFERGAGHRALEEPRAGRIGLIHDFQPNARIRGAKRRVDGRSIEKLDRLGQPIALPAHGEDLDAQVRHLFQRFGQRGPRTAQVPGDVLPRVKAAIGQPPQREECERAQRTRPGRIGVGAFIACARSPAGTRTPRAGTRCPR